VVPLFLGQGGHLRRDLPELIQKVSAKHPLLSITAVDAAGEAPVVLDALVRYCLDSIGPGP
jgi:sirohydrochlorin cobaltochelatase